MVGLKCPKCGKHFGLQEGYTPVGSDVLYCSKFCFGKSADVAKPSMTKDDLLAIYAAKNEQLMKTLDESNQMVEKIERKADILESRIVMAWMVSKTIVSTSNNSELVNFAQNIIEMLYPDGDKYEAK